MYTNIFPNKQFPQIKLGFINVNPLSVSSKLTQMFSAFQGNYCDEHSVSCSSPKFSRSSNVKKMAMTTCSLVYRLKWSVSVKWSSKTKDHIGGILLLDSNSPSYLWINNVMSIYLFTTRESSETLVPIKREEMVAQLHLRLWPPQDDIILKQSSKFMRCLHTMKTLVI